MSLISGYIVLALKLNTAGRQMGSIFQLSAVLYLVLMKGKPVE